MKGKACEVIAKKERKTQRKYVVIGGIFRQKSKNIENRISSIRG